ncbi:restriction endonuclease subunit S [Chryseobacterium piperi]|uniref:restriction endonuclease subunit S n=1 Tax=Chryseobacterium piperi TaxID=558152 RepID=UPI00068A2C53|nr:restriction endonuclease subunit S [Chryseobacterium piperi]ASW73021.1 restriction endonuclease subunit S [Chryseobacterium piperi]
MMGDTETMYKNTSIRMIPVEWEIRKFGEVANFINGRAYKQDELLDNGNYRVLRVGNLKTSNEWYWSDLELDEDKYVKNGDLIYAWSASFGPSFWKEEKVIYHYHIWKIIPISIDKVFLYQTLIFDTEKMLQHKQGGTMFHITKSFIENRECNIPPPLEQQKIAQILSTWDKAIQETTDIIKALEKRNKVLAFSLLTGKKRLKEFKNDHFKKSLAKEVFKNISIKNNDESQELLSATQENGIIPRSLLEGRVTMPTGSVSSYKLVKKGNFVISLRSFQGGIEYSNYEGIVSPAYTVLKAIHQINEDFYKFYFKSTDLINRLSVAVIGIRDGKNISYDDFSTIALPNPSLEEQNKIADVLNKANQELQQYKQKLENLKQQKKGLMQQLLTGKIRTM